MTPDAQTAIDFLRRYAPEGPWSLATFSPTTRGACCNPNQTGNVAQFVQQFGERQNVYFLLGIPDGQLAGQPKKERMRGAAWLWVDLDPRSGEDLEAERARILALLRQPPNAPPPSAILDSGRGYWGLWRLAEPCTDPALVERHNKRLANLFGAVGDDCWNINRVGRLPGTVNQKTGSRATIVEWHDDRAYALDDMPTPEPEGPRAAPVLVDVSQAHRLDDLSALDQWGVSDRVKRIIAQGRDPEAGPKEGDDSRSAWLYDAVCNLVRAGVPDDIVFGLITDPAWGISESVLRRRDGASVPRPESYALRQIEKAKAHVAMDEADFERSDKGVPYNSQRNIRLALRILGVVVRHDEFQDRLLIEGLPECGPLLDDRAMTRLWLLVDERFRFRPPKEFFFDVVSDEARRNRFHPVLDYLAGLQWDGQPRVDRWLAAYGGAADTPYVRAVGALLLIAAVRRLRQPGCKFDEMPVLEGDQGTNKSSALATLAVNEDWFSDDLPLNADGKRVIEALAGRWLVEAAELKGMRRGDVEHLKSFLSRQVDRARMSYDRLVSEVPRQCVIVGTTNSSQYLRDGTGNRRFWPVKIDKFDLAALRRDRDQLWAEAVAREAEGASIRLDPALWGDAAAEQEQRKIEDPLVAVLGKALGDRTGKIAAADIWDLTGIPPGQRTQEHNARLGEAMRELGWERTKLRFDGKPTWAYARGDADERGRRIVVLRGQDGHAWADYEPAHQTEVPF